MGQKVRPTGFRTGIMRPGGARGTPASRTSPNCCVEDVTIRTFIQKFLTDKRDRKEQRPGIAEIRIERTRERVTVVITQQPRRRDHRQEGREDRQADQGAGEADPPAHRGEDDRGDPAGDRRPAHRRGHRRAAGEAGQLPPHDEAGHAAGDGGRGQGHQAPAVRPARRGGNGPVREGHGGQHPALDAAGKVEYGFAEATTAAGEHRDQGLDQQRRLPDRRIADAPTRPPTSSRPPRAAPA